jgi:hypothetical protein
MTGVAAMQNTDIRDAKFYLVRQSDTDHAADLQPLSFDDAFRKAETLSGKGEDVRVLYTDEASQMQLTRFAEAGIRTALAPGG